MRRRADQDVGLESTLYRGMTSSDKEEMEHEGGIGDVVVVMIGEQSPVWGRLGGAASSNSSLLP